MITLHSFESNNFSQFGEDGVIQELLNRISSQVNLSRKAIEFGASDGIDCSNTRNLLLNHDFHVVYIESSKKLFRQLQDNTRDLSVSNILTFVNSTGLNTLEAVLKDHKLIEYDFDLLVIDIDGNDYWILESISNFRPKIICIEFNPTIPIDVSYIQPRDSSARHGSSALAIMTLAMAKGYSVVHATSCNLFLVRDELSKVILGDYESVNSLPDFIRNPAQPNHCFSAIDGTLVFTSDIFLHWHRIAKKPSKLQVLPFYLRKATGDYNPLQRLLFFLRFKLKSRISRLIRNSLSRWPQS